MTTTLRDVILIFRIPWPDPYGISTHTLCADLYSSTVAHKESFGYESVEDLADDFTSAFNKVYKRIYDNIPTHQKKLNTLCDFVWNTLCVSDDYRIQKLNGAVELLDSNDEWVRIPEPEFYA